MHIEFKRQMCTFQGSYLFEGPDASKLAESSPQQGMASADPAAAPSVLPATQRVWTSVFNSEAELLEKGARHLRWVEAMGGRAEDFPSEAASTVVYVDAKGMRFGKGLGVPIVPPEEPQFPVTLIVTWSWQQPMEASAGTTGMHAESLGIEARTWRCVECGVAWVPESSQPPKFCPNGFCSLTSPWV